MTLKASHIAKSYGEHMVLEDTSLEVSEGHVFVLMGANGSGKTTLFNIISGYIGQDSGEVLLDGREISTQKTFQRKVQQMHLEFQN